MRSGRPGGGFPGSASGKRPARTIAPITGTGLTAARFALHHARTTAPLPALWDGLVHPAVADPLQRLRHRAFLAGNGAGGVAGLALFPAHLALAGLPSTLDATLLGLLATPLVAALLLSRTGRLDVAQALATASVAALAVVAATRGGQPGFAAGVFCLAPVALALAGARRLVLFASLPVAALLLGLVLALPAGAPGGALVPLALGLSGAVVLTQAILIAAGLAGAQQALRHGATEGDERYRLLAENVTDMISRHTRSGLVLFASPTARALTGAAPDELADDGLFQRVHVADRPAFLHAFSEAGRRGAPAAVEFRLRLADGSWRWAEMRCRPLAAARGGAVEIVAVTRDVEERKRQEEALRSARDLSEQASAAKTRFLANMSHELRTPLNAIIGFADLMGHDSFDNRRERVVEYSGLVADSGRHLLQVVNAILDMSRIEAGCFDIAPEPFDAPELARNVAALMQPAAAKAGVTLATDIPLEAPELDADRRACKQILLNLLSNAVKFTGEGGRVVLGFAVRSGRARFTVADTGIGIAPEDLSRLATPFLQLQSGHDRPHEGSGLGLSVVKGLAELHGGELLIASTPGRGTTATVELPLRCRLPSATVSTLPARQPAAAPTASDLRHATA